MAKGRLRECQMCSKPIAFRVAFLVDGQTVAPEGGFLKQYVDVCTDHIDHFKNAWLKMSGLPPGSVIVKVEPQKPPPPLPRGHHVVPETFSWWEKATPKVHYSKGYGLVIECRSISPESYIGRPVLVDIPEEMIIEMLKVFREAAIEARSTTMAEAEEELT